MLPDFLTFDRSYACFWFDKEFKNVIIPIKDYKNCNIYAEEYKKVFNEPFVIKREKWYKIVRKLRSGENDN